MKIYCGKCGFSIPLAKKYIQPHYSKLSNDIITKPALCCYRVRCPSCRTVTEYSKDYMRDVWKENNKDKQIAIKI